MLLGLYSQWAFDTDEVLELLAKDQDDLLRPFHGCDAISFKALLQFNAPIETSVDLELHLICLVRGLLELSGGTRDFQKYAFNQQYAVSDNFRLYGRLVGISGTRQFGDCGAERMYQVISTSKVFVDDADFCLQDLKRWTQQMMEVLPIGFPKGHLVRYCP